jgi:phosphoinositide-3-kinase regulatory subunit 4
MGNVSDKLAGVEAPAASAPHLLLVELSDFEWVKTLGGTRLLKTLQCRYGGAPVTVKVHLKKSGAVGSNTLTERWATAFNDIRDRIAAAQAPGLLTYQRLHETERAGFLIRQHFASNLYDRFSTQPFLSALEKQWVAYQLLRSVAQMHEIGIVHGSFAISVHFLSRVMLKLFVIQATSRVRTS